MDEQVSEHKRNLLAISAVFLFYALAGGDIITDHPEARIYFFPIRFEHLEPAVYAFAWALFGWFWYWLAQNSWSTF